MTFRSTINLSVLVLGLLNRYTRAMDHKSTGTSENISQDPEDNILKAIKFAKRGDEMYKAEMYPAAIYLYTEAIKYAPQEMQYYRMRASCHKLMKEFDEAISDIKQVLVTEEYSEMDQAAFAEILYDYGKIYDEDLDWLDDTYLVYLGGRLSSGDDEQLKKALTCFDKAISMNPHNAFAFEARGQCRRKLNDLEGAIEDFEETLARVPFFQAVEVDLIDVLLQAEKYEEAREALGNLKHFYRTPITRRPLKERVRTFEEKLKEVDDAKQRELLREEEIDLNSLSISDDRDEQEQVHVID